MDRQGACKLETMKDTSLERLFKTIIETGLKRWELGDIAFDLFDWKHFPIEMIIQSVTTAKDKASQGCKARGICKIPSEIGFTTFAVILISFRRNLPVEKGSEDPVYAEEILGCEWSPTQIKYCPSRKRPDELVLIDLD